MFWLVELETAAPDDSIDLQATLEDSLHLLGADTTTGTFDAEGWIVRFEIEALSPTDALYSALMRTTAAVDLAHLPEWPIVAIRVLDVEFGVSTLYGIASS